MGPPLLGVVTQDASEREVQQVGGGVVRHAGQALRLKAHTSQQGVLALHSSGEQGMAQRDKEKAACEGIEEMEEKQQVVQLSGELRDRADLTSSSIGLSLKNSKG